MARKKEERWQQMMEGHSQPTSPARGRKNSSTLGTFLAKINKDRGGKKDGLTPESYRRAQSASDLSGYVNLIPQRSPTQKQNGSGGSLDEMDQDEVIARLVAKKNKRPDQRKGSKKTRLEHEEEMEDDDETIGGPTARRCSSASHLSSWDSRDEKEEGGEESEEEGQDGEEGAVNSFSDLVANHKTLQSVILRQGSLALPATPSPSYFRRTSETEKEREKEKERERNRKEHQDKAEIYRGLLRVLFYRNRVSPLLQDVICKGIKSMAHGKPHSSRSLTHADTLPQRMTY